MIYGIGTDIIAVERIEAALARFGERFARRILTATEWQEFTVCTHRARFLAKRFAAKESFSKAVGTGMRHPVSWQNISVVHNALGQPSFGLTAELAQNLAQRSIHRHHLSISDESKMVVAFSVLEQNQK